MDQPRRAGLLLAEAVEKGFGEPTSRPGAAVLMRARLLIGSAVIGGLFDWP
jgi:hypothetical protein